MHISLLRLRPESIRRKRARKVSRLQIKIVERSLILINYLFWLHILNEKEESNNIFQDPRNCFITEMSKLFCEVLETTNWSSPEYLEEANFLSKIIRSSSSIAFFFRGNCQKIRYIFFIYTNSCLKICTDYDLNYMLVII